MDANKFVEGFVPGKRIGVNEFMDNEFNMMRKSLNINDPSDGNEERRPLPDNQVAVSREELDELKGYKKLLSDPKVLGSVTDSLFPGQNSQAPQQQPQQQNSQNVNNPAGQNTQASESQMPQNTQPQENSPQSNDPSPNADDYFSRLFKPNENNNKPAPTSGNQQENVNEVPTNTNQDVNAANAVQQERQQQQSVDYEQYINNVRTEHQKKLTQQAIANGIDPEQYIAFISQLTNDDFLQLFKQYKAPNQPSQPTPTLSEFPNQPNKVRTYRGIGEGNREVDPNNYFNF